MIDNKNYHVIGVSYKKANLDIRGLFNLSDLKLHSLFLEAKSINIEELLVISTCNRTELYGWCETHDELVELLCNHSDGKLDVFLKLGYKLSGNDAINHMFKVGTGLDSQILGDFEIIGQLRKGFNRSKRNNLINGRFERLINSVIHASKRIKTETQISSGATSVAFASVQYILNNVSDISKKKIVLFGAGKIGRNTCENLVKHTKNDHIILINRTKEKADKLAVKFPVKVKPYGELVAEIKDADVLITATSSSRPTITRDLIHNSKPLLILDLSIPRNVEASIDELVNINVIHLDELSQITDSTLKKRKKHIPQAELIISEVKEEFLSWLSHRKFAPTLKAFKERLTIHKQEKLNCSHNNFFSNKAEELAQKITGQIASFLKENPHKVNETITLINDLLQIKYQKND